MVSQHVDGVIESVQAIFHPGLLLGLRGAGRSFMAQSGLFHSILKHSTIENGKGSQGNVVVSKGLQKQPEVNQQLCERVTLLASKQKRDELQN